MAIRTANVWAQERKFEKNRVRQLLVPKWDVLELNEHETDLTVSSPFGSWQARRGPAFDDDCLTGVLPVVGDSNFRVTWSGSHGMTTPEDVRTSFKGAIGFRHHDQPNSLRRPQIAALHAIIGYLSSGLVDPAVVVMPTGTGKTETMIAWMVAQRPRHVLVLVPSTALRDQLADKFETLGVLQREGIVGAQARRPCVGRLESGFKDEKEAKAFVNASNVIVATPQALQACERAAREALFTNCTHLVVDEAHHAPAMTWAEVVTAFEDRPVLLFTATPFREDRRALPGRVIFRFPLREAQRDNYFSSIEFKAILGIENPDAELASAALGRLREDHDAGLSHILLARARNKDRARELHNLYSRLAPDLKPCILHDDLPKAKRLAALRELKAQESQIVVCVNMLGEGFDLPTLKVGAFHDPRQSLSPMLQLVGRLARTTSDHPIGTASVFVPQHPSTAVAPLRGLLREDPDWNSVIRDVSDRATSRVIETNEFDESFDVTPSGVPVPLLEPKMSAVAFRTSATEWDPDRARQVYGSAILDDVISISTAHDVAWFVVETQENPRWGTIPGLQTSSYDLVIMFFDRSNRLLFVHGSDTDRTYLKLAEAVFADQATELRGTETFRVFSQLDRVIPTNVGLLDVRDRDRRFSLVVGSDVEAALDDAEKAHKFNTHIAAKAFENGERITIASALSGRFWSMQTASGLIEWREWCRRQGKKLADESIDLRAIFRDMIIPVALTSRPNHPLVGMEWPWQLYLGQGTQTNLLFKGKTHLITDVDLRVDDYSSTGPFRFSAVTDDWEVSYSAVVGDSGVRYRPEGEDAFTVTRNQTVPLATWMNSQKPTLFLAGDRMITGDDRLLEPRTDVAPYDRSKLHVLQWENVNIKVESQGTQRDASSIQAFMVRELTASQNFDVLIDDDRSGEAADLVGLRIDHNDLVVTLVHCKYSSESVPGGRLKDLYELCGQAIRGARWRDGGCEPLLRHLDTRAIRYATRTGSSAYEVGDRAMLMKVMSKAPQLFPRLETILVQPGLSLQASSDEQMRLIAGAESYVRAVTKGGFRVFCSA